MIDMPTLRAHFDVLQVFSYPRLNLIHLLAILLDHGVKLRHQLAHFTNVLLNSATHQCSERRPKRWMRPLYMRLQTQLAVDLLNLCVLSFLLLLSEAHVVVRCLWVHCFIDDKSGTLINACCTRVMIDKQIFAPKLRYFCLN